MDLDQDRGRIVGGFVHGGVGETRKQGRALPFDPDISLAEDDPLDDL